jgi:hypothetical protein
VVSDGTHQWYERHEARAALAARDVGAVYRLLQQDGSLNGRSPGAPGSPSPRCQRLCGAATCGT